MDDTGATRDDLKVPEGDVGDECNNATAEGRDIMVSHRISANSFRSKSARIYTS